jgi:hypothetical protein
VVALFAVAGGELLVPVQVLIVVSSPWKLRKHQ